jgi:hypothetical protein
MTRRFGNAIAGILTGLLLAYICFSGASAWGQEGPDPPASPTNSSLNTADSVATSSSSADSQSSAGNEPSAVESSLFSSLFMAGRTQEQFTPLTPGERFNVYARDLLSPFHFFMAGTSAAVSQAQNVPAAWGQGAEGYGKRFANYYASATVSDMLQMAGEDLLHEDNLYYGSGYHGIWKRVKYAVRSSVLARSDDGTQHLSMSQIGSTAAAAFISRTWQPRSNDSAGDGAVSFGIQMATNAGVNVVREFLPDITRHIFHRRELPSRADANVPASGAP